METPDDLFAPHNDLSLILQGWRAGGAARDVAFDLADRNCRASGHVPVTLGATPLNDMEVRDERASAR